MINSPGERAAHAVSTCSHVTVAPERKQAKGTAKVRIFATHLGPARASLRTVARKMLGCRARATDRLSVGRAATKGSLSPPRSTHTHTRKSSRRSSRSFVRSRARCCQRRKIGIHGRLEVQNWLGITVLACVRLTALRSFSIARFGAFIFCERTTGTHQARRRGSN